MLCGLNCSIGAMENASHIFTLSPVETRRVSSSMTKPGETQIKLIHIHSICDLSDNYGHSQLFFVSDMCEITSVFTKVIDWPNNELNEKKTLHSCHAFWSLTHNDIFIGWTTKLFTHTMSIFLSKLSSRLKLTLSNITYGFFLKQRSEYY